jgi:TonB-dependent SusC/RagA subfamily outer membrane receptor
MLLMECQLQQEELVEEETLTTINNIESISVLKDASATAIYGSRAQWCNIINQN